MIEDTALKICHLTPTYFSKDSVVGGGERYVYNLVKAVSCASIHDQIPVKQSVISVASQVEQFSYDGVDVKLLKDFSPIPGAMNLLPDNLGPELEGFDVSHIHQSLTLFGEYATAITKSKKIPIVATDLGGGSSDLMLFGKGLELADTVLSISNYAKSLICSNFSGRHEVIIGPVDTDFFRPGRNLNTTREKTAICVSRIMPHKGIDRIISALPDGLPLKVVGQVYDVGYFELLQKLAKDKDVEFIHDADDQYLLALYQTAGLFLQASTHKDIYGNTIQKPELMGLTTLEAMSCGLPVIISDAGSLPELAPDKRFGKVFSSQDDLKGFLSEYLHGDWPSGNVSELARNHVVNNYSFLSVGRLLIELYKATHEKGLASRKLKNIRVEQP